MSSTFTVGSEGPGDQRNVKESEREHADRFHEGKEHSHNQLDSKDERTIANKLAAEEQKDGDNDTEETRLHKIDPTLPAIAHGNEPSKGAKVDAQIEAEEQAELERKGKA